MYGTSELGSNEELLQECGLALRDDPNDPDVHGAKGDLLYSMRSLQEAEECFRKAIRLAPDDPTCAT